MIGYSSNFSNLIIDFIDFKNSLGIQYKSARTHLKSLDIYNLNHENVSIPDKSTVEGWLNERSERANSFDRSWIPPVREFGRYLHSRGISEAYIVSDKYTVKKYHANVYLMTNEEIYLFFEACDDCSVIYGRIDRGIILKALFRFMYCCGVRCIETRKLKCNDVHLNEGYVDIIQSKGNKNRRLYLSDELTEYLNQYNNLIEKSYPKREYFFPGIDKKMLSTCTISHNFKKIWISAGLEYNEPVRPRAYDFRHHFACENIRRWSEQGKDVQAMLTYLMRYMGHSSFESTYYYVHLIPDFFPQYSELTISTEELIPEVEDYEI